jgi:hypothetical protein
MKNLGKHGRIINAIQHEKTSFGLSTALGQQRSRAVTREACGTRTNHTGRCKYSVSAGLTHLLGEGQTFEPKRLESRSFEETVCREIFHNLEKISCYKNYRLVISYNF